MRLLKVVFFNPFMSFSEQVGYVVKSASVLRQKVFWFEFQDISPNQCDIYLSFVARNPECQL